MVAGCGFGVSALLATRLDGASPPPGLIILGVRLLDLLGRASLIGTDLAVPDVDDPVGVVGHVRLVGHEEHGDTHLLVEPDEGGDDLLAGAAVQIACRLVGQDERWPGYQRAGDGHPLLLPARKLRRLVVDTVGEPDRLQRLGGQLAAVV